MFVSRSIHQQREVAAQRSCHQPIEAGTVTTVESSQRHDAKTLSPEQHTQQFTQSNHTYEQTNK